MTTREAKGLQSNQHQERAMWLRDAVQSLRSDFTQAGMPLPENIRLGFSTKGKGTLKTGEAWHSPASGDGAFEIFVRADQDDPMEILAILVRELVHITLVPSESRGKKFKAAATRIGLVGRMRDATPGHLLEPRLRNLADALGPIPHAAIDLSWKAIDAPKKQTGRMLKAICAGKQDSNALTDCGYTVRLSAKWAKVGAMCPLHGLMAVEIPTDAENEDAAFDGVPPTSTVSTIGHQLNEPAVVSG